MIQTHALALLRPDLLASPVAHRLDWIDGLVAPSFILTSGFALALVQVRAAHGGHRLRRTLKNLRRIGEVLLVACYMVTLWFPIAVEPRWLWRIDILQCIGLSLLAALPLFALLAGRPRLLAGICAALGIGALVGTPLVWRASTGFAAQLFSSNDGGTPFPLFPWAGYIFLGGSLGALAARGKLRDLVLAVVALGVLGAALIPLGARLAALRPGWQWWVTENHGQRVLVVSALILLFLAAERWLPETVRRGRVVRFFDVFGTSSLAAYFGHEVMLFKNVFGVCFHTLWGKNADWAQYWMLVAALIALTLVFTWIVAYLYDHAGGWLRALREAASSRKAQIGGTARDAEGPERRCDCSPEGTER
jgi:uncharacterized membrane protein